jgi:uncharacterized protein (TIGR00730 family)
MQGLARIFFTLLLLNLAPAFGVPTPSQIKASEALAGYDFARKVAPQGYVAVLGGTLLTPESEMYLEAEQFGLTWNHRWGTTIPLGTGGGPAGAMGAANLGAKQGGGRSLGFVYPFPGEGPSPYLTDSLSFTDIDCRRSSLIDYARAYVFIPGGIGTHEELAEALTKIEAGTVFPKKVILLGGHGKWRATLDWLSAALGDRFNERVEVVPDAEAALEATERVAFERAYKTGSIPSPVTESKLESRPGREATTGYIAVLGKPSTRERVALVHRGFPLRPADGTLALATDPSFVYGAKAIYAYPGDIRTQWQVMLVLNRLVYHQIAPVPMVLVGDEQAWAPLRALLQELVANGSSRPEVLRAFTYQPQLVAPAVCDFSGILHGRH